MRRDLRACVGVGLLATLLLIVVSGFWVGSTRDFIGISMGYAWGLVAAYSVDAVKRKQASRHD